MNLLEKLTQQKLQEILLQTYLIGNESNEINIPELIEKIKQQILASTIHRS